MVLVSALEYRWKLEQELFVLRREPELPCASELMAKELERLKENLVCGVLRSLADGTDIRISVDNNSMRVLLSNHFGLTLTDVPVPSLEIFREQLLAEVQSIQGSRFKFHLTLQLTLRVIELLEEEISRQQSLTSSSTPLERSWFYREKLEIFIEDAIITVQKTGIACCTSYAVLDILRNNRIVIDDYVRSTARQRFFEATFIVPSSPAPVNCCRFLALIIQSLWRSCLRRWFILDM